jgi:hypothetical protein
VQLLTWVHVFEQDTPDGAVFLPEDADIPLSRRPRLRLELGADGSAALWTPGPDDRPVRQPARWIEEGDHWIVCDADGVARMRIVERSADRLVVKMSSQPGEPRG